jgi:exonuclease III
MDLRFGTWNVRSMSRAGSLRTEAEEVSKHKLDLVGVQEVRWDRGGTEPAGQYTLFYGKGNQNHELGTGIFVHKRIISAVKKVVIGGPWCDIIVPNVHALEEDKIGHIKDTYKEQKRVFDKFHKYHIPGFA